MERAIRVRVRRAGAGRAGETAGIERFAIRAGRGKSSGMFFNDWNSVVRTMVVGICAYAALIVLLRGSGKRTLSKLNAFDFVVTVALGSTLATILLSKQTALAEGVVAFGVLIFLQYAVAWLSTRSERFDRVVKSDPKLLFFRGRFLRDALRRERVVEGEVLAAVREQGLASLQEVEAVVLETAGTLSVLKRTGEPASALGELAPDVAEADAAQNG